MLLRTAGAGCCCYCFAAREEKGCRWCSRDDAEPAGAGREGERSDEEAAAADIEEAEAESVAVTAEVTAETEVSAEEERETAKED